MSANVTFVTSFLLIMSWVKKDSAKFFVHNFGDDKFFWSQWFFFSYCWKGYHLNGPMAVVSSHAQKDIYCKFFYCLIYRVSNFTGLTGSKMTFERKSAIAYPMHKLMSLFVSSDMFDYMVKWTEVLGQRYRKINKYNYTYIHTYVNTTAHVQNVWRAYLKD